jgi:malonyl-CoA/methylmalonyl-CoA synthetase
MTPTPDLIDCLERHAREQPQQVFLRVPQGIELTYAALQEQTGRFAAALLRLGVRPGDRVAVQVEKSPEAILLYLACLRLGAAFVPINSANTSAELEYFLTDAEPRVVIVDPARRQGVEAMARLAGVSHVESLGEQGDGSLIDLVRRTQVGDLPAIPPANTLGAIVYTSGTTGRSKGAMLTRANLASNASVLAHAWRFTANDVLLHVLPLYHIHGLFVGINTLLVAGAGLLFMPKFDAAQAVRQMNEATVFMGVPTHYTRLLQQPALNRSSTERLRLFVSGSAPLLAETHEEFSRRTGHAILERYGMTETLINTSNPYEGARVPGAVGPPLAGTAIRIVAEASEVGAIEVKGPNVFAGYWRAEEKTRAEFTPDGWFKTGDLGRFDANGYLYIVGRAKDLVISGGFNVYPKEVESELDQLEGVLESAVFGVPHPDFGEGVTAVVVIEAGAVLEESALIAAVQLRLARYKVPKRVLTLSELPRNAMGKVQKNELRKIFASLYTT